ncbi:MAG: hypothetical protein ACRDWV_11135 [Acidimicrobiales bacterium]
MATELHLDPVLVSIVDDARKRAAEAGELSRGPFPPFEPTIPAEARTVIVQWLHDGGYASAVALIGAEDPDLANL